MTVIAWDGKILAADKQTTTGNTKSTVTKIKSIQSPTGLYNESVLIGCTGFIGDLEAFIDWYNNDTKDYPHNFLSKESRAIIILDYNIVHLYESNKFPITITDPFYAIGSGRDFAIAAMHCGKTSPEAVHIACMYDAYCGRGMDTLTF